jgi:hypothetical protein
MSDCPYSDEELEYWNGVCNPMGDACNGCQDYECEHNLNDPYDEMCWQDMMEAGDELL